MSETVKFWYEDFLEEVHKNPTLEDIEKEIKEAQESLENNKLWLKGSLTDSDRQAFESNIEDIEEYLEVLNELKNNL